MTIKIYIQKHIPMYMHASFVLLSALFFWKEKDLFNVIEEVMGNNKVWVISFVASLLLLTIRIIVFIESRYNLPSRGAHMSRYFWLSAFSIGREERIWEIHKLRILSDNIKYFFCLQKCHWPDEESGSFLRSNKL